MLLTNPLLERYAIRDLNEIVPGRKYAIVHSMKNARDEYEYDSYSGQTVLVPAGKPFATVVWVTGIVRCDVVSPTYYDLSDPALPVITYAYDTPYGWNGTKPSLGNVYSSDAGIWGVGSYKNRENYMLDLADIEKYTGLTFDEQE